MIWAAAISASLAFTRCAGSGAGGASFIRYWKFTGKFISCLNCHNCLLLVEVKHFAQAAKFQPPGFAANRVGKRAKPLIHIK